MKELTDLLRDGDPIRHEGGMAEQDVMHLRQVLERVPVPSRRAFSPWRLALAGVVVLTMALLLDQRTPPVSSSLAQPAETVPEPRHPAAVRQVQFATPGGTRMIWVFDPNFDVR